MHTSFLCIIFLKHGFFNRPLQSHCCQCRLLHKAALLESVATCKSHPCGRMECQARSSKYATVGIQSHLSFQTSGSHASYQEVTYRVGACCVPTQTLDKDCVLHGCSFQRRARSVARSHVYRHKINML